MKKLITFVITISLLFSLSACISKQDLEDARQEGYDEGYSAGESAGYDTGYADGEKTGYNEGYDSGEYDGWDTGFDVGYGAGWSDGYDSGYDDGYDDGHDNARLSQSASYRQQSKPQDETISTSSNMVYVSRTGSKYHSNPNCSGMNNPSYVSLEDAISQGRTACSKCY